MNDTKTDIAYLVTSASGTVERVIADLDRAILYWARTPGSSIQQGYHDVVHGKTVWVRI